MNNEEDNKQSLGYILTHTDSEESRRGFRKLKEIGPFPHYYPHPELLGMLIKTNEDNSVETGHFVGRFWTKI